MAAMDTLTGGQQRGDSPLNPIYVAVVYSLSGAGRMTPGIPGYGIPSRDLRTAEGELGAATAARSGRLARVGSRFSGLRSAGGLVGDALMLTTAYELAKNIHLQDIADETQYNKPISSHSLLNYVQHARSGGIHLGLMGAYGSGVQIGGHSIATKGEQAIIDRYRAGQISADEAERRLRRIAPADQLKDLRLQVVGKADVNVTVKNEQGKKIGKTHVTTDLFGNFTTKPAPQTKAKPKTQRGGN